MRIMFAEKCAWRAIYVYRGDHQVFHLGFDPGNGSGRPQVFAGVELGSGAPLTRFFRRWRFVVPHIAWRVAAKHRWLLPLYRMQSTLLCKLDGRYGWGSKQS